MTCEQSIQSLTLENLKKAEIQIASINRDMEQIRSKGGFLHGFKLKRLDKLYKKNDELQFENVDMYLYQNSSEYRSIGTANLQLFVNPGFQCSVETKVNIIGSYSRVLKGSVHANGHAYLYASQTNSVFQPFGSLKYPEQFQGQVDRWGRIEVRATRLSMSLFKNLPTVYEGRINESGFIDLQCIKREFDLFHNGRLDINKLVGNMIPNTNNLRQFEMNKIRMVDMIEAFRKELN